MQRLKKNKLLPLACLALFVFASPFEPLNFVTLSSLDAPFPVHGSIIKIDPYTDIKEAPVEIEKNGQYWNMVRFTEGGFYRLTTVENGRTVFYSIFASPIPTVYASRSMEKFDWYQTQFNSGTLSNCGPASGAMAISWSTGHFYPTSAVRNDIGWRGDGAVSLEEIRAVIRSKHISADIVPLKSFEHIKTILDEGNLAIIVFKTDGVASNNRDPKKDFFDKYYVDNVGHYIVVKGYSADGNYLVVNDPIPSDWRDNSFRHNDGISMIGKNRYYKTKELLSSLRRADMLVVEKVKV